MTIPAVRGEMLDVCLQCGATNTWMHLCNATVVVIDPELHHISREEAHPLDRLSVSDMMQIYGLDVDAQLQTVQEIIDDSNEAYLNDTLMYRVEFHNLSGLGFQGVVDFRSVIVQGHSEADLYSVLDILNSDSNPVLGLNSEDIYLCRLVSLNSEGVKYVWQIKQLRFDGKWKMI